MVGVCLLYVSVGSPQRMGFHEVAGPQLHLGAHAHGEHTVGRLDGAIHLHAQQAAHVTPF